MRGIKSYAMVLAATSAEGKVELVDPPPGSKPGDRAYFEGYEGE
jgi:aminoacyl tRNA synthase complex-interacting multifunctional protein 1